MLGPVFLLFYRLIELRAQLMQGDKGRALKARWALRFSAMTDGGLDDDFAEQAFQLVRQRPELIGDLERQLNGNGLIAQRQRWVIETLRQAVASGRQSLF